MSRSRDLGAGLIIAVVAAACSPSAPAPGPAATVPAPAPVAATPIKLPVSINEVMVALVDHASEPLWLDSYTAPKTDGRWLEAEYNAYQLAISGKLIQLAGSGPNDAEWVADPQWQTMADELSDAGMQALNAAKAKDVNMLNTSGDRLVAACEACHKQFKPGLTSMGVYKSPNYLPKP